MSTSALQMERKEGLAGVREYTFGNCRLPLVLEPLDTAKMIDAKDVAQWLTRDQSALEVRLLDHGGILLRNFPLKTAEDIEIISNAIGSYQFDYIAGATPRTAISGKIFESTRWPAFYKIKLHNEMSYMRDYPAKIMFFSRVAAQSGGETIIADMRKVYQEIRSDVRESIEKKGVCYIRNFKNRSKTIDKLKSMIGNNMHRSWQDAFSVERRDQLEALCVKLGLQFRWLNDGSVTVANSMPGIIEHPATKEKIWFNQTSSFHPNRRSLGLLHYYVKWFYWNKDHLPFNARYGDGSEIPIEHLYHICDILDRNTIAFPWKKGDLLILDNRLVAHGRNPFKGPREVMVSMIN